MATRVLVCLVVMFVAASAVPLVRDDFDSEYGNTQCARRCRSSIQREPLKFEYSKSKTYVYEYKAEAETSMAGASEDKARMHIETLANIEVIDTCEFALRLQDVNVYHSEPYSNSMKPAGRSQDFQTALMENTLRFSYDDGIIKDICPSSKEKIWVLNFKRGLLSAFQNSMDTLKSQRVKEVDVSGECNADYVFSRGWRSIDVTKSKNLTACRQHSGLRTFIPMVQYNIASEIQSLPIIKSSHECEQVISSSKILESTICTESHVFSPLSNHQSGGATKVKQSLKFKATKRGIETSSDSIDTRSNLLFQHINGIDEVQNSREAAEQKLKEICEQTKTDIRPETPRLFTELVQIVKVLESSDLRSLYRMIKNKRLCSENDISMKFLLDTLPIAGTPGAVELMATVINGDDLPDLEKDAWLTSLSLIPEPSEDILPSLVKLVSGPSADKAILPVTALLNTMCRKSVDCDRSFQFQKIVKKISDNIGSSCTSEKQSQLMETLRAIGNVGYGDDFLETLKTCLSSSSAPLEVKVAAADGYRRFRCQEDEETGPLFQLFESQDADPELRIMSFLSLMRCPRDSMLRKIAAQLDKEEDVHVGTFVYTHLKNLKETSDPHKQDIARAVENLNLREFKDAGFKTSRCYESSTLLNRLNLGYVADGDVIWSQSSMVPRAMKLNLTVELFGNSVNLFETGARIDGLEKFIKKYFGMEGYLTPNEASPEDLEAFIYARMFGNELFFKHVKGSVEYERVKSYLDFDKLLENLSKDYNLGYTHSQQLMDHSLVIPTAIGLPVNVTINSTVTVDTRAKGTIDLNGILSRSKPIAISNDLAASAALEISGSMMVDAKLYKHGLRMRNTLHSSVSMKSDLTIRGRQIVDFQIDSPQQKQELFEARSKFFIIHDNFEKEQEMIKDNRVEYDSCTGDKFATVTGLELCGKLQYPNASMVEDAPYFPITGPVRASLVLNKKDTQRNYKIFAKWIHNSKKLIAQLILDTPGSQVDRHISADVTIGTHKSPHVDVVLISPWKKLILNGKAASNKHFGSLTGSMTIDGDDQYKLTSEYKTRTKKGVTEYVPFVEVENNGERITLLSGTGTLDTAKYIITTDLNLKDLNKEAYTLDGRLALNSQEKRVELSAAKEGGKPYLFKAGSIIKNGRKKQINPELLIAYPKGTIVSLTSSADVQAKPLKVVGNMEINAMRMRKPIKLKVNIKQSRKTYRGVAKLETPIITGNVNGKLSLSKKSYGSTLKVVYRTRSLSDEINWDGKLQDRSKNNYMHYNVKSNLKFKKMPNYNTMSSLEITRKTNNKVENSTADLSVYYGRRAGADKSKSIQISTLFNADWKKAQVKADLKTKVPEMGVDLVMAVDHLHTSQKFDSEVKFSLASQLENDIIADVHIQNKGSNLMVVTADGNLEAGGGKYTVKTGLYQKSQKRYEHSVTVTIGDDDNHKLVTIYKSAKDNYQITSKLESTHIEKPLSLQLSSAVEDAFNFHVSGALKESNRELYSVDALSKLEPRVAGKLNFEVAYPLRKVIARANFNNVGNRITTKALVNWDAESRDKQAPEVDVTGLFTQNWGTDSVLLKGNIKVNTPFENLEKLSTNWNLEKSGSDLKTFGKVSWGGIHKQISTGLTAKLPISIESAKMTFQAKTPFKNYKEVELEVDHILNSEIKSTLRGKVERDETKLVLNGKSDINDYSRSIEGELTLKTPFRSARQIVVSLDHSDDERDVKSSLKINKDGQRYSADILSSLKHDSERRSQIKLSGPWRSAQTSLTHKIQDGKHQIEASIDSALSNNRRKYNVEISGHYLNLNDLKLNMDIKSPLKSLRKGGLEICLNFKDGVLENKIIFEQNHGKTGYDIKLKDDQNEMSADVLLLLSPLYEHDVKWNTTVQYDNYPMTIRSEINWAPYKTVAFSSSYKAENSEDFEIQLHLVKSVGSLNSISMAVSNTLKNAVRVSHLTIDYTSGKTIDIEVRSRNDDEKKLLRLKAKVPSLPFKSLDTGVSIDKTRGLFSKADLEMVMTNGEKYEGLVSLKVPKNNNDNFRGKLEVNTPVEGYKHIEGSLVSDFRRIVTTRSLLLKIDDVKMVDFNTETKQNGNKLSIKVITEGTVFETVAKEYSDLLKEHDVDDYVPNILKHSRTYAKKLTSDIVMEKIGKQNQWTLTLTPQFETGPRPIVFKLNHIGESWADFGIESSVTDCDRDTTTGKIVVQLVSANNIKFESNIKFPRKEQIGMHFSLSGDLDHLECKGGLRFFCEGDFSLVMESIQFIEFTSKLQNSRDKFVAIKYKHEGQDNRASCSFSVENDDATRASIDLVLQSSPIHIFSLTGKTPFDDYNKIVISGDYDETKINGLIELNEETMLSLSAAHDSLKNPQLTLTTPLRHLQDLTFNVNGDLSDGSSTFTLKFNDDDQIGGNVAIKYESPSQIGITSAFNSKIDESENTLKIEVENTVEPRKTSKLLLSLNDLDKITYTSDYQEMYNDKDQLAIDLNMAFPSLGIEAQGLVLHLDGNTEKATGYIELLDGSGKRFDADVNLDLLSDKKATVTFRKPMGMEYSFTQGSSQNENEIYLNWDKTDPDASLVIGASYKDDSTLYKLDKSVSLRLSCPSRSIGIEHAIVANTRKVESSGKLYWDNGFDSQVSYDLTLKDQSNRRISLYDGEMKLKLPSRTIGVAGSASDRNAQLQAETTFSWDLDNDSTKKIGLKGTLQKDHTQADISLILPKDAHVDSKLVMNKGNTILEGQTQIFYSDDSMKTLTLFSKLENNPGQSSYFYSLENKYNYSIAFGMSHPDSRIDVKMVSHLGVDSDRLTTAVGLDYLTSRRQTKNVDLFMEINKLKKEISIVSNNPYKSISVSGAAVSQDPVDYKGSMIVDDEERYATHLVIDPTQKTANLDWTTYGTTFSYSAFFLNQTALQVQRKQQIEGPQVQDYTVLFQLVTPEVLQTTLNWRRGLAVEARDRFFTDMENFWRELKEVVDDVGMSLKQEVEQKYTYVSSSIFDDAKLIVDSMEEEVVVFERELGGLELNLQQTFDFCTVQLGEYVPLGAFFTENVRFRPVLVGLRERLQSLSKNLDELKKLPAEDVFDAFAKGVDGFEMLVFGTDFWGFFAEVYKVPQENFDHFWDNVHEAIQRLDPQEPIDHINRAMERFRNVKVSSLIINTLESYGIVSELKNLIKEHGITEGIATTLEHFKASEIYRMGQHYDLDENIPIWKDHIIKVLIETIDGEVHDLLNSIRILRNPITRFDPENGVLQAEIPIFISLDRLDQLPTVDDIFGNVLYYVPDDFFGGNASGSVHEVIVDDNTNGFDEYVPNPRYRTWEKK